MVNQSKEPKTGVPTTWPGAFGVYKYSKRAVKPYVWTLVCAWLIAYAIIIAVDVIAYRWHLALINNLASWIVSTLLTGFTIILWLAGVRDQDVEPGDAWRKALHVALPLLGVNILVGLALVASLLAFIIPFFFVLPRLVLASYYLVDQELDVVAAFQASWNQTKGYSVWIWGIIGASFAMCLLMVTIIGIPFAIYFLIMYSAATAVFYEYLIHQPEIEAKAAKS